MTEVSIAAGNLSVQISPSIGGGISGLEWTDESGTRPILRKCNTPFEKVLDAGCFPLVPYVNRIRGGSFTFRGKTVHLQPNMAGDPSPLHGQGWLNPWMVEREADRSSVFAYSDEPGEWPWSYEARQEFSIDERGFSIRLSCRNTSDGPMPCGLGEHPYFPCGSDTRIDMEVDCAWTIDRDVLPVERVPADGRYDLRDRLVCGQDLDNGFGEWTGEARLTFPSWPYELRLSSPQAKLFQVYSPPQGGFFVAEP
jgi:aldose 1-epimerase